MKISIVVPVYNTEKYLEACLESVIKQTASNWELILVNDGSTDKSADICNSYSNKYPDKIFVYHKENEGQFMTRKFGIHKCTGDYIGFMDSDDLLDKDYVSALSEYIVKFDFPDSVCFGFVQFSYQKSKDNPLCDSVMFFSDPEERKTVYEEIVNGNLPGSLWSKAFKRDIVINNIPCEDVVRTKRYAEDAYHSFDVLAQSKSILFINKSLYYYRDNVQGFSQGFDNRPLDYFNSKYLFERILYNLPVMGMDNEENLRMLCERNFNETVYYMLKYFRAAGNLKEKKRLLILIGVLIYLTKLLSKLKTVQILKNHILMYGMPLKIKSI